jgi:hypothetical protein
LDLIAWPAGSALLTETPETFTALENLTTPASTRVFLRPVFQLP